MFRVVTNHIYISSFQVGVNQVILAVSYLSELMENELKKEEKRVHITLFCTSILHHTSHFEQVKITREIKKGKISEKAFSTGPSLAILLKGGEGVLGSHLANRLGESSLICCQNLKIS